jgi:hypothetical protein
MESLSAPLRRFVEINQRLIEVNTEARELREKRQTVELDLAAAYNEHNDLQQKVELSKSKMMFVTKKPGEWKKGWSLSKKQLQEYLLEILPEHGEDVFQEIVRTHEPKIVSTDYMFELKPIHEE